MREEVYCRLILDTMRYNVY